MVDQSYDRDVQFARNHLARDIAALGRAIVSPFKVLARINFDAPWNRRAMSECQCDA